jgi:hypothetical protein
MANLTTTTTAVTWSNAWRACRSEISPAGIYQNTQYTCPSGQVCAATPGGSFQTALCIVAVVASTGSIPASCPPSYPSGPIISYFNETDSRTCSGCSCATTPTGGSCGGTLTVTGVNTIGCNNPNFSYPIGTGCSMQRFSLPSIVGNIGSSYTLTPGQCPIVVDGTPDGGAMPTGSAEVICCASM